MTLLTNESYVFMAKRVLKNEPLQTKKHHENTGKKYGFWGLKISGVV